MIFCDNRAPSQAHHGAEDPPVHLSSPTRGNLMTMPLCLFYLAEVHWNCFLQMAASLRPLELMDSRPWSSTPSKISRCPFVTLGTVCMLTTVTCFVKLCLIYMWSFLLFALQVVSSLDLLDFLAGLRRLLSDPTVTMTSFGHTSATWTSKPTFHRAKSPEILQVSCLASPLCRRMARILAEFALTMVPRCQWHPLFLGLMLNMLRRPPLVVSSLQDGN